MPQIACHECDLLLDLPTIQEGQRAYCPRCNHLLCSNPRDGIDRAIAFSVSGIAFLLLANIFPFLSFHANGREQVMTLIQSSFALYNDGNELLAAFILMFIIIAPALLLGCIIWVLVPLQFYGKRALGAYWLSHLIFQASPWSMAEIFLIGILVSLTKIASLATVVLGISFWGYIGFTVCFTVTMANLDKHHYWNALDEGTM